METNEGKFATDREQKYFHIKHFCLKLLRIIQIMTSQRDCEKIQFPLNT